jgi:hypothetical protein
MGRAAASAAASNRAAIWSVVAQQSRMQRLVRASQQREIRAHGRGLQQRCGRAGSENVTGEERRSRSREQAASIRPFCDAHRPSSAVPSSRR